MPRFYFDTYGAGTCSRDERGMELPDCHAARREAMASLLLVASEARPGQGDDHCAITDVWDETGEQIFSLHLYFGPRWDEDSAPATVTNLGEWSRGREAANGHQAHANGGD